MQQDKLKDVNESETIEFILNSFENFCGNFITNKDTLKGIISLCRVELEGKPKKSDEIKWIDSGRRDQLYPPIKEYEILEFDYKNLNRDTSLTQIIKSVRRLSDNEVFSINDITDMGKICGFTKQEEVLFVNYEGASRHSLLSFVKKSKQSLLTTEDGKQLYNGDFVYGVSLVASSGDMILKCRVPFDKYRKRANRKWFSTNEAAEKYINLHKQRFSLKDIHEAMFLDVNQTLLGAYELLKNKYN